MPDTRPHPTTTPDEMESQLDALGRALAAHEREEPSPALLSAVRSRAERTTLARWSGPLALAATVALVALVYTVTLPAPAPPTPPITRHRAPPPPAQSFAALRTLNRDATPETLRFPSAATSSARADPGALMRPRSGGDPESVADLLGSSHER